MLLTSFLIVFQGAFHVYGAKTSRQVFLFEKGVVIAKKKEDSMLSCKIFILVGILKQLFTYFLQTFIL